MDWLVSLSMSSVKAALNSRIRDPYNPSSIAGKARARRWAIFSEHFPDVSRLRILDLGGTPRMWQNALVRPKSVTTINLLPQPEPERDWIASVQGDVFDRPETTSGDFDLVYCNSLIEHVGGHAQRQRLADLIHGAAPLFWVQAPYRYFPVEPHWLVPGMQFLPLRARIAVARHWDVGGYTSRGKADREGVEQVMEVELPTATEFRHYFPDGAVRFERFLGLPKSLIAVKS